MEKSWHSTFWIDNIALEGYSIISKAQMVPPWRIYDNGKCDAPDVLIFSLI